MKTAKKFKKYLEEAKESRDATELKRYVINMLLDYSDNDDDIIAHAEDIVNYGWQNGTMGWHIYTSDNRKFFSDYFEDIEDLYRETCESIGENLYDYKRLDMGNWFAWFAIERTISNLFNEAGIDL